MIRPVLLLAALLGLAACATVSRPHGSAAQNAACARRADEVYLRQNRGEIYRDDAYVSSSRDARFSGAGAMDAPSLSGRFAREQLLDNCLSGRTGAAGATPEAPDPILGSGAAPRALPPARP